VNAAQLYSGLFFESRQATPRLSCVLLLYTQLNGDYLETKHIFFRKSSFIMSFDAITYEVK